MEQGEHWDIFEGILEVIIIQIFDTILLCLILKNIWYESP